MRQNNLRQENRGGEATPIGNDGGEGMSGLEKIKENKRLFVVKDIQNRPDDKWCLLGTRGALAKTLASEIECSMSSREIKEIPDGRRLYWVELHKLNWAGSGGGSSEIFPSLAKVQEWIIERIKEWHIDIGEVKFEIYPVYPVSESYIDEVWKRQQKLEKLLRSCSKSKKRKGVRRGKPR